MIVFELDGLLSVYRSSIVRGGKHKENITKW